MSLLYEVADESIAVASRAKKLRDSRYKESWDEVLEKKEINAAVLLLWMEWSTLGRRVGAMQLVSAGSFVKGWIWIWIWLFGNTLSLSLSLLWELATHTYHQPTEGYTEGKVVPAASLCPNPVSFKIFLFKISENKKVVALSNACSGQFFQFNSNPIQYY